MSAVNYTCTAQPGDEMGKNAAELLFRTIDAGGQAEPFIQKKFPCTLYKGNSVKKLCLP
jgi:DNA-binding LacI/PurR family transcriptional regulator